MVVANNILSWGLFPWLTSEFEDLLPVVNIVLGFNIVLNLVYMAYDERKFKAVTQIVVNVMAIGVVVLTWQIYPFDFSAYDFPVDISAFDLSWDLLARFVLGVAILGTAIAVRLSSLRLLSPCARYIHAPRL